MTETKHCATFTPMKDKDKFRIPKIKLGEVFEVDGNLYVITIRKDAAQSSNLSNNRNIYELKLM